MSEHTPTDHRTAFTFAEFADLFGKDRSWTYRLAEKNKISVIRGYGCAMIPASEVTRISTVLGSKTPLNGPPASATSSTRKLAV